MKTIRFNRANGILVPVMMMMLSVFVASCTEIISIDFNEADPQLVVEAYIPQSHNAEVIITKTVNCNADYNSNEVTGARVMLENGAGDREALYEYIPGHYRSVNIKGIPGEKYKLTIETEDKYEVIESIDVMPAPVPISKVRVKHSDLPEVDGVALPQWEVVVEYTDPEKVENYYRFIEYLNGKIAGSYVETDKLNDGKKNKYFLTCMDRQMEPGDTLTIEMQSISKAVYDYFYGFSMLNTVSQGYTSVNPISNISGVKLGYFSAHTVNQKTVIIE